MRVTVATALIVFLVIASPAMSQYDVSFTGCGLGWGAGARSNPGERLDLVATVHLFEPSFPADPTVNEYTLVIPGLISTGTVDFSAGLYATFFRPGSFTMHGDPNRNATYDANPPNSAVPSSFADGAVHLSGTINEFIVFGAAETVTWHAVLRLQDGEVFPYFRSGECRLAGSFTTEGEDLLPGYSLSTRLAFWFHPYVTPMPQPPWPVWDWDCASTVGVESRTWGGVKHLYRN